MHCHDRQLLCIKRPRRCIHDFLDHDSNVHAVPHRLDKTSCLVCVAAILLVLINNIGFKHVVVYQSQDADMCVQYSVLHNILAWLIVIVVAWQWGGNGSGY